MGSGFPLSGVIASKKIFNNKSIFGLSSTHSANPIACAAGIATIDIINKKKLVSNSMKQGKILHKNLSEIVLRFNKILNASLGHGLIASLIFKNYKKFSGKYFADKVSQKCLEKGLLVCNTGRESIKLGPPLTMTDAALLEGISVIKESISEIISND